MAKLFILTGCGTALVTPFKKNGDLDEDALRKLVEWQITSGINFLVPCGSTGEAVTMTMEEHLRVVAITAEVADHRVPIVAGAGSNDTAKAIAMSKALAKSGATHLLHVTPMYNKPPQRGMLAHFRAVADSGNLRVILYNVPGRTGINLTAETTLKLAQARDDLRHQGSLGQPRPDGGDHPVAPVRILGPLRRRCPHASRHRPRRQRRGLRGVERGAEGDDGSHHCRAGRRSLQRHGTQ